MQVSKYNASGNDFVIFHTFLSKDRSELARKICSRTNGVGADGLIVLLPYEKGVKWEFYNSDGSYAAMCGNGSRAAARYAYLNGLVSSNEFVLLTGSGEVMASVKNECVEVVLTSPKILSEPLNEGGKTWYFYDTGVPHLVNFTQNLEEFDVKECRALRQKYNANVKIVEVPPGPPVLSTIVAEVYGPNYDEQMRIAKEIEKILQKTDDVVDIDTRIEDSQKEFKIIPDKEKSMLNGVAPQQIVGNITYLMGEYPIGNLYDEKSVYPIDIVMRLNDADKANIQDITSLKVKGQIGMIPVSDLVKIEEKEVEKSIYRKDQQRVVYVMADMAGALESPAYAILGMDEKLKRIKIPNGYKLNELYMGQPNSDFDYTIKWDGEWQITLEVFRDFAVAFAVVLIIIYMLIVGWFQNFKTPFVMMIAIPLSLIGIVLGHWLLDAFFTATSFIGMIALTGVMVRNSVLLIDFIEIRLEQGEGLKQAIIEAGAVRTTPILLTTGAVVIGAMIILFDPIFQGLAISLVFGAIVSTLLTLVVVPLVYYMVERKKWKSTSKKECDLSEE